MAFMPADEAREIVDSITKGGDIVISENSAKVVMSDQFVELVDLVEPGAKSEVTITRDGKILGRVIIER
jgi:S1-C subfamily serine protease